MADFEEQTVSLDTLCGGGVIERFNGQLTQVIANVLDPNTGDGVREITLKVKVKPDTGRSLCAVSATVSCKILPPAGLATSMFIGMDPKLGAVGYENNPKQMGLFNQPKPEAAGSNVVSLSKAQ